MLWDYSCITVYGPLAAVGFWMRRKRIWQLIAERVEIKQKVCRYEPIDKLLGVLITILTGAGGLVESNTRVRSDEGLQRAFGLDGESFPDQSTLSETINACEARDVAAFRGGLEQIYQSFGRAMKHPWKKTWLILDIDLTGMPCGGQGEGATKCTATIRITH